MNKANILRAASLCLMVVGLLSYSTLQAGTLMEDAGIFKKKKKTEAVDTRSDYDKLLEGSEQSSGLMGVIKKGKDYYFSIPTSLLGRDLLVVNRLQRVPKELNEAGVNRGVNYEHKMIRLEWDKQGERVLIREQRPLPLVPNEDAIQTSVHNNYISPLIAAYKLETKSEDSSALIIKVNDIYNGSETSLNNVFDNINLGTSAITNLSRIQRIQSFASNVVAYSELTTKVREGNNTVNVTVEVSSSILLLPERPMQGRLASHRVGYFTTPMLRYSDAQHQTEQKYYIQRWRLEPKEEDKEAYLRGELVAPQRPIVFYIDPATPRQWRQYIKAGVEDWQRAFERAGWRDAIRAVDVEAEGKALQDDDVSYSLIHYAASQKKNAMGPSLIDPRSGEILEADIMWWHNVMAMLREWLTVQTGLHDAGARRPDIADEAMGRAIRFVACHEVGHSLGLRHNMMASNAYSIADLRSPAFTEQNRSTAASVMDYARYNYVAQPEDGVRHISPGIGAYDLLAIEYGYRWYDSASPEAEQAQLNALLARHSGKEYRYSEAQDTRDAVDPRAQIEDLGDDPIEAGKLGIQNLKRIVPNIIQWTTTGAENQTWERASDLYYATIYQWNNYLYHALANIGGIYIEHTSVGDGQQTYTHVPKAKQRAAMQFLIDEVLTHPAWLFEAEVGRYTYLMRRTPNGLVENAPSQILRNTQGYILWDMLSNNRLVRMMENEATNGASAFTTVELLDGLHRAIFASTERGAKPSVHERSVQKNFLDALLTATAESESVKVNKSLLGEAPLALGSMPMLCQGAHEHSLHGEARVLNFYGSQLNRISDAISVKRGELLRIKRLLTQRLAGADTATRYHYEDMILRINTALGTK